MALIDKTVLMGYIQPLTGLLATSVVWEKDPEPFISPVDNAIVKLNLLSYSSRGIDDVTRTFTSGMSPFLTTVQQGLRSVNLQIKVEVYNKSSEAVEVLETIRTALKNLNNIYALNALGLALFSIGPTIDLPTHYDNRVVSVASMTISLGATSTYTETPSVDGWMDTVNTDDTVPGDFS